MTFDPSEFEPVFDFDSQSSLVVLKEAPAGYRYFGNFLQGRGTACLELGRRGSICFHLHAEEPDTTPEEVVAAAADPANIVADFSFDGRGLSGFCVERNVSCGESTGGKTKHRVRWHPGTEPFEAMGNDETEMQRCVFHLFNFVTLSGPHKGEETRGNTRRSLSGSAFEADGWRVRIRSLFETQERFKLLKAEGGYQLTHVGEFTRLDGVTFTGVQCRAILNDLRLFFSFAKGGWIPPVCPVGFDADSNRVWEQWSSPNEPWHRPFSWLHLGIGQQLESLFPGFIALRNEEGWRETVHEVLYWYLNANDSHRGIDPGIILTQTALERLSFEYLVNHRQVLSRREFKNTSACDRFLRFFSKLKIPTDIPDALSKLVALSKEGHWDSAPKALTRVRNSLVHPDPSHRDKYAGTSYETWRLGQWFLELAILRLCEYSMRYFNRVDQKMCVVPWEKSGEKPGA